MRVAPLPSPTICFATACVAGTLALPAVADAATALSKSRARTAAVQAARETCAIAGWCRGIAVEPARSCARRTARRVDCEIRFRDAQRRWSAGLVIVSRVRGKLEVGCAVPSRPGDNPVTST